MVTLLPEHHAVLGQRVEQWKLSSRICAPSPRGGLSGWANWLENNAQPKQPSDMNNTSVLDQVLPTVIKDAAEKGTEFTYVYQVVSRALTEAFPVPEAQWAVAGFAGRRALMQREGGCVDAKQAAELYVGAHADKPAHEETVRRAAREKRLISIRDGRGEILFPVWQFMPEEGGPLPDLSRVLKELALRPGFSDITPFLFFLQPHPRLGASPLKTLREGKVNEVLEAAKEYRF